jgi:hypothetical protein
VNDWCFALRDETRGIAMQRDCVGVRYVYVHRIELDWVMVPTRSAEADSLIIEAEFHA